MTPTLTPLHPSEAALLAGLVMGLYADDPGPVPMTAERALAQVDAMLAAPAHVEPLLVRIGDEVVGYAILVPFFSNEFGGLMLYVDELWVRPERRGQGLGTAILRAVAERARARGFARLAVEVNRDNVAARRLYERLGFAAEARSTLGMQLRPV